MYTLNSEQLVPVQRDEIFEFFARPENLAEITPPWLRFEILTPAPVPMRRGTLIDYSISLNGLPARWRSLITEYEPPLRFVDEQLRGPYDFWHHTHEFEETSEGTLLIDRVRYQLPFGPLGRLVHAVLVRPRLERIFSYRREVIARRFGSVESTAGR